MIEAVLQIAQDAGEAILEYYGDAGPVDTKGDNSPLTQADRASHDIIDAALKQIAPTVPVVSEEGEVEPHEDRAGWSAFWLVDPLDGTKEFIKQTGEFTVNIALIADGRPVLGVVFAPVIKRMYWTDGQTSWRLADGGPAAPIVAGEFDASTIPVIVASRDHAGSEVTKLIERHPEAEFRSMGSSLKFCLVAEGSADLYLRDVPTMEWDTAAAHAIVLAAGAQLRCIDGSELAYNKADFRNPGLVTFRSRAESLL